MLLYKEKDIEEELIDFDDFDKPKIVGAYITRMFVCNENVSLSYIEENSNDSNLYEEDNSESPISLKNCSNNKYKLGRKARAVIYKDGCCCSS